MKEYENIGKPVAFVIDGVTIDWKHGEIVKVNDDFKERIEDHLQKLKDVTPLDDTPTIKTIGPFGKIKLISKNEYEKRFKKPEETEAKAEVDALKEPDKSYSKESLEKMTFSELREIGSDLDVKFRSKIEGIEEILEAQG